MTHVSSVNDYSFIFSHALLLYSAFAPVFSVIVYMFYSIVLEVLTSENNAFKVSNTSLFTYLQVIDLSIGYSLAIYYC